MDGKFLDCLELQTIPFPSTLATFKFCHLPRKRMKKEALVTSLHSSPLRFHMLLESACYRCNAFSTS
ncbi:hypothetical protein SUGI_0152710 [Cryptomeria japonica]|nr:hypothetical protein SUGI_0152710 [Cryptomeria japonica]